MTNSDINQQRLLLFGATGTIGGSIGRYFEGQGWQVVRSARHLPVDTDSSWVYLDPFAKDYDAATLHAWAPYSAVCWAQGKNCNDDIYSVDLDINTELYRANCQFVLVTLKELLARGLLIKGSRLCVISSIWQNLAKQNKLSYCMTKAALQGLVMSASADLANEGHLINAILPGALDTPMTRQNLSTDQINNLQAATRFGRLPKLEDVAALAYYLCSEANSSVTGQFIAVDLGFSHVRIV